MNKNIFVNIITIIHNFYITTCVRKVVSEIDFETQHKQNLKTATTLFVCGSLL